MSRLLVSRFAQKKDGKRRGGTEERRSQFRTRKYRRRWRREGKGRTPSVATSTSESAAEGVVASIYQSHLLSRNDTSHLRLSILLSTVIVSVFNIEIPWRKRSHVARFPRTLPRHDHQIRELILFAVPRRRGDKRLSSIYPDEAFVMAEPRFPLDSSNYLQNRSLIPFGCRSRA